MPKITYIKPPKKEELKLAEDAVIDLINRYQKGQKIKSYEIAVELGIAPDSVSRKKTRGSEAFTLEELFKWCFILHVPPEELADAIVRQMQGKKVRG